MNLALECLGLLIRNYSIKESRGGVGHKGRWPLPDDPCAFFLLRLDFRLGDPEGPPSAGLAEPAVGLRGASQQLNKTLYRQEQPCSLTYPGLDIVAGALPFRLRVDEAGGRARSASGGDTAGSVTFCRFERRDDVGGSAGGWGGLISASRVFRLRDDVWRG